MKHFAMAMVAVVLGIVLTSGFADAYRGQGYGPGGGRCIGGKGGQYCAQGTNCPGPAWGKVRGGRGAGAGYCGGYGRLGR